jgi:1,2-diacylglycerol 3-beta-glucosyltransferase
MGWLALLAAPFAIAVAAMSAYLTVLGTAAVVRPRPVPRPGPRTTRFALLVPAHDEELVIERVVRSLRAQSYPEDRFDIFVVADNCTDATAEIARRAGAVVHERQEPTLPTKGHALRWLLERVRVRAKYGAYVVIDADSVVTPEFLGQMDARLASGSLAVQSSYRVLNAEASTVAALREAALASLHYLRPLGRAALGLSCGLKGNGMCFDSGMLDRLGWGSFGLAEDVELHLALVRQGVRVDFAPEAVVRSDMPLTLKAARSQNLRWEAGRLSAVRHNVLPLIHRGLARRDPMLLDAAAEQLIPPLSVAVTVAGAAALVGVAAGSAPVAALAIFGAGGLSLHVLAGLAAIRAPAETYRALLAAPAYVAWKLVLYARAMVTPAGKAWVRTERQQ